MFWERACLDYPRALISEWHFGAFGSLSVMPCTFWIPPLSFIFPTTLQRYIWQIELYILELYIFECDDFGIPPHGEMITKLT